MTEPVIVVGNEKLHDYIEELRFMALLEGMIWFPYMKRESHNLERLLFEHSKPLEECLLPTCHNTTSHNGGYCCADHCREHRRIQRGTR
jgi:hypothetical protein